MLRTAGPNHIRLATLLLSVPLLGGDCSEKNKGLVLPDPDPASIALDYYELSFNSLGESKTLKATVTNASGDQLHPTITWESEDEGVATVDDGVVTSVAPGMTLISASVDDLIATVDVDVEQIVAGLARPEDEASRRGTAGEALPSALVVTVTDANGRGIDDVSVYFFATGGAVSPERAVTSADGTASATWTLDTLATEPDTPDTVWVSASDDPSGPSVWFAAGVDPGPPWGLSKLFGEGETWIKGDTTGLEVVVRVVDRYGNGVEGEGVAFDPRNGGWAEPTPAATDARGVARTGWFMGNWDPDPYLPEVRPDTLDVTSGALGPVPIVAKVLRNVAIDTWEGDKVELSRQRIWFLSVLHTCPDSNVVRIIPTGLPAKTATVLDVAGQDCVNPRIYGRGDPGFPPEYGLSYEMPDFGLTGARTWRYEVVVRGVSSGIEVGNNRLCPAAGCDFSASISASPDSVPRNAIETTIVTLDSYVENPELKPLAYQWVAPPGTTYVSGTRTGDPIVQVIFPDGDEFPVALYVSTPDGDVAVTERVIRTY